jgi:hypothetical protein
MNMDFFLSFRISVRLAAVWALMCLGNVLTAAILSGSSTTSSADGDVQIQTDMVTGKITILRPTPIEMQVIRKRADAGDDSAALILSQIEYAQKNFSEGERWARQAAYKGNIYAEYRLGAELAFALGGGPKRLEEGFVWLKLSAYEGNPGAQSELARCYRQGIGVDKDDFEAFSWGLISIRSDFGGNDSSDKLEAIYRKFLSDAQMERAKLRAKNFVPTVTERNPFVDLGVVKLTAISESNGKPIVLLNEQAFTVGEQKKMTWLGRAIELRCLEIRRDSVIVATEPYWQRGEVFLPNSGASK